MPIYEYKCQKCGHALEVMAKVSDPAPEKCANCGAENAMERLVSRTNFQLKGGGWYSDLYSSAKKDSDGSSTAAAPSPATSTSTTTPAAASTATPTTTSAPASSGSSGTGSAGSGSGSSST